MTFDDIETLYPENYSDWKSNIGIGKPDGGESCAELYNRVVSKFYDIINHSEYNTICIVTHATPIRMMESYMFGNSVDYAKDIAWVPNASISIYQYDGNFHTLKRGFCDYLGDKVTNLPKNI